MAKGTKKVYKALLKCKIRFIGRIKPYLKKLKTYVNISQTISEVKNHLFTFWYSTLFDQESKVFNAFTTAFFDHDNKRLSVFAFYRFKPLMAVIIIEIYSEPKPSLQERRLSLYLHGSQNPL